MTIKREQPYMTGLSFGPTWMEFSFPYIGGVLSVNRMYTLRGRVKRQVREWRDHLAMILAAQIRSMDTNWDIRTPVTIVFTGDFRDKRSLPDLTNLHKIAADAISLGIGVDDKYFLWRDTEPRLGAKEPNLRFRISWPDLEGLSE